VLVLALLFVLVWYTFVSPSCTAAPPRAAEAEPPDAEERELETRAAAGFARSGVVRAALPRPDESGTSDEGELDWPEIIGGD
jgi:hypothetical protein